MSYRAWRLWVKSLPKSLKWFVYLILLRPIIDNFYYLKLPILALSMLEIVGLLTPVLILFFAATKSLPQPIPSSIDSHFRFWSTFVLVNGLLLLFDRADINSLGVVLKVTAPVYLYYFTRRFIRSTKDLIGILQTLLYACLFPLLIFCYELVFAPIKVELSRGVARSFGGYADVFNYSFYVMLCFLVLAYFTFTVGPNRRQNKRFQKYFLFGLGTGIVVLFRINHVISFVIFFTLSGLFLFYNIATRKFGIILLLTSLVLGSYTFVKEKYTENINPLIEKDLQVIEGAAESRYAFHGRFGRWTYMWATFSNIPFAAKLFAPALGELGGIRWLITAAHNDYLRMIFQAGFVGFFAYLIFLLKIFKLSTAMAPGERFLVRGALIILLLYSVTSVPTLYLPLMYIILSIFAFAALPLKLRNTNCASS